MEKIIPILPCQNIGEQLNFYCSIGFEIVYTQPNTFAVIKYNEIILHFWVNKKLIPNENAIMHYIENDNTDKLYEVFINKLKENGQKIPPNGIPRISKIRELKEDKRFTLVDPAGNTFYIGTPNNNEDSLFFRTLENKSYAKKFSVFYDIVYSKEDYEMAKEILPKIIKIKEDLNDIDKAKLLLLQSSIQMELGETIDENEIKELIELNKNNKEWEKIERKYNNIMGK